MANSGGIDAAIRGILYSVENQVDGIRRSFETYLRRPAEDQAITAFLGVTSTGGEAAAIFFVAISEEYFGYPSKG